MEPSIAVEREIEALRRVIMEVAIRAEFGGVLPGEGAGPTGPARLI